MKPISRATVTLNIIVIFVVNGPLATLMGWIKHQFLSGQLYFSPQGLLTEQQTRRVFALARSEVWRINKQRRKSALLLTVSTAEAISYEQKYNQVVVIEDIVELAGKLTLERKALETLDNLSIEEQEIGAGVEIPYFFFEYPGRSSWEPGQPPKEVGITHGCTSLEAPMVYQLLLKRALVDIRNPQTHDDNTRVFITPDGYSQIDDLRSGSQDQAQQAFLVCRFTNVMDRFYTDVYGPVGDELKCPIRRIKDIHHVDKIDDRICEEIRRSSIIVVDLTDENFNIAFEAGFALALNKPIVWTKQKEAGGVKMPFDIYTHNCLEWDANNLEQFRQDLKFRLLAALQKASNKRR